MGDRGNRGKPSRGVRSDRNINEGHSRGLDQALAKTESHIRNLKTERVYAYDKNGKEIAHSAKGSKNRTYLPDGYSYKDAVLTHNHPGKNLGNSIGGRIGRSFSGADLGTAISQNAAEVRAVTGTYTYSIKRPKNGWGMNTVKDAMKVADEIKNLRNKLYEAEGARIVQRYDRREGSYEWAKQALDRADVVSAHNALKTISKKYGWNYTRKKTS